MKLARTTSVFDPYAKIPWIFVSLLFIAVLRILTQSLETHNNDKSDGVGGKTQNQPPTDRQYPWYCGPARVPFDRKKGDKCIDGTVVSMQETSRYDTS